MRGKLGGGLSQLLLQGNISACAGKTTGAHAGMMDVIGTSPRMWGKLGWAPELEVINRNIPAYAGKTA